MLGVDWLRSLGPVTFDFKKLQMRFDGKGQAVKPNFLHISATPLVPRSFSEVVKERRMVSLFPVNWALMDIGVVHLHQGSITESISVQTLLQLEKYKLIFQTPTGLPPDKGIANAIDLKEGS